MELSRIANGLAKRTRYHGRPASVFSAFARYWHLFIPYMTPAKLVNVLRAHTEMSFGSPVVHANPYMLRIEPTNNCNFRCPGCATGLGIDRRTKGFLSVDNFRELIEQMKSSLLLTRLDGLGEPFLHPNICELCSIAHNAGSAVALSSHLGPRTLTPSLIHKLIDSGLDHLIVSIDGPDAGTYSKYRIGGDFETTCSNVRQLSAAKRELGTHKPFIEVQCIGFNHNRQADLAGRMLSLVNEIQADRLTLKLLAPETLKERRATEGRGQRCFWLYTTITVGWDGARKLCPNSMTDDFALPNVFVRGADPLADPPLLQAVRHFLAGDRNLSRLDPLIGDPRSQLLSWKTPRDSDCCRCLACGGVGLVVDRTRNEWIDEYVCM
jgi:hypothetical protein